MADVTDGGRAEGDFGAATSPTPLPRHLLFGPDQAPYSILLLAKVIDRVTAQDVREEAGLTLAEWRVIAHLFALRRCSASTIAKVAEVERSEVSRAVATLERRGLIAREPKRPDGKRHNLVLTAEGEAVHAAVRKTRTRFFQRLLSGLHGAERTALDEALHKVMNRAEQELARIGSQK